MPWCWRAEERERREGPRQGPQARPAAHAAARGGESHSSVLGACTLRASESPLWCGFRALHLPWSEMRINKRCHGSSFFTACGKILLLLFSCQVMPDSL